MVVVETAVGSWLAPRTIELTSLEKRKPGKDNYYEMHSMGF